MKILLIVALFLAAWFLKGSMKKQNPKILFVIPQKFPTSKIEWEFLRFFHFFEQAYPKAKLEVFLTASKSSDKWQIVEILSRRLNFDIVAGESLEKIGKNYYKIYEAGGNWRK